MAEEDIIQNLIRRLGQNQDQRSPGALDAHHADIDERTTEDFLRFTAAFAEQVNFYRHHISDPTGNWVPFFSDNDVKIKALLKQPGAGATPHLALFLAFLELYKKPLEILNRLPGAHLDFFYREVLQFKKKSPAPDKAHVLIELKSQSLPLCITAADVFTAGKDTAGLERIYAPTTETIINTSQVASLRALFVDHSGHGTVRCAPVANSFDGVGGPLRGPTSRWHAFGRKLPGLPDWPASETGFGLASPVLRMKEGLRQVTVTLTLGNLDPLKLNTASLQGAWEAFLTGENKWLGPFPVSPSLNQAVLQLDFTVPASEPAITDYHVETHGYAYPAAVPIVQLMLNADGGAAGYHDFNHVILRKARLAVRVSGVTALELASDIGAVDPRLPFQPFGPQPAVGSQFSVGCAEALNKKLSRIDLAIRWKMPVLPMRFASYYHDYSLRPAHNGVFTAQVVFHDGGNWNYHKSNIPLFQSADAGQPQTITLTPENSPPTSGFSTENHVLALRASGRRWALEKAENLLAARRVFRPAAHLQPEPRPRAITFSLERDFQHVQYRTEYVAKIFEAQVNQTAPVILNEPYTPTIQSLSLSYHAFTDEVPISSAQPEDFANPDLQFYHLAYFGPMREHGYQRQQFSFLADSDVSLLPAYTNEGELLIGLSNLRAGDSVSLLFQVAEGSADPELDPPEIVWSVLCDNYWKPLGGSGVVLDTTRQLLTSGIIKFVIPAEATTQNTILPENLLWLRAGVAQHATAVSQLIEVAANAIELQFVNQGNDLTHLETALEAGSITKLKSGSPAVQSVRQPYASFQGRPAESDPHLYRRASERLRHKDRCITSWDYERMVLEAFPKVHHVKCIPHAKEGSWLAPGHVLLVVIPDLKNRNIMDPLQPRVEAATLRLITDFLRSRAGMQVQISVQNPRFQKIQLEFKVKFYEGCEFNFYRQRLQQQLIQFLSPWAFQGDRVLSFGGKVYKSVVLDFVEKMESVHYVTDFKMFTYTEGSSKTDVNEARPETPDALLVSAHTHVINPAD